MTDVQTIIAAQLIRIADALERLSPPPEPVTDEPEDTAQYVEFKGLDGVRKVRVGG